MRGRKNILPALMAWLLPIALVVPNIVFCFTEGWGAMASLTDVLLPAGLLMMLASASTNIGRTVLWCIPLMVFSAFQIVLLFLYGGSVIAVDMFLNVVTTNVGEATELLANLDTAIITVLVLYLPLIVWGIVAVCRKVRLLPQQVLISRRAGLLLAATGVVSLVVSYAAVPGYSAVRQIFPINAMHNLSIAVKRASAAATYRGTSADFTYGASSVRDSTIREVYVMVIGETSRADNWHMFGYGRQTTPRLERRDGLVGYARTLSESNTTHKSVPMLMSWLDANTFGDYICTSKSIITAYREAGFRTAFFSNQSRNHSYIDFFGEEADTVAFISDASGPQNDMELICRLKSFVENNADGKIFAVLHAYGSHFRYNERYPVEFSVFRPDAEVDASRRNREQLINAYDNTILYTDAMLDSVISVVNSAGGIGGMVYASDHGEDMFDDTRSRFLHASPTPTYWQLHVPMLLWLSDDYRKEYPEKYVAAVAHRGLNVSSTASMFHTLLDIAGIASPYFKAERALTSGAYTEPERIYITDHNLAVPLMKSGLRDPDMPYVLPLTEHGM